MKNHTPHLLLLALLLAAGAALPAQNWNSWGKRKTVRGDGQTTTDTRKLIDFTRLDVCCGFDVELAQGDFAVEVEAERNLQELIRTEVRGSTLSIGWRENVNVKNTRPILVRVSLPALRGVAASSGCRVEGTTSMAAGGAELELDASSGARIELDYRGATAVEIEASSGSRVDLRGDGQRIYAEASSSGRVSAQDFRTEVARARASSGANVSIHAERELHADASSGGRISYSGNPAEIDSDASSGGRVRGQ